MRLNAVTPKYFTFCGNDDIQSRTRREKVEDAATVTGGVGAGAAATRSNAFRYFKSSEKLRTVVNGAANTTEALAKPAQQTKSLWNALKLNYKNLKLDIADWAKASKMPNFMKAMFTGKMGTLIGGVASVFVFISGIGEVAHTLLNNVNKLGNQVSAATANPYV